MKHWDVSGVSDIRKDDYLISIRVVPGGFT
jgi:hypothetical protein